MEYDRLAPQLQTALGNVPRTGEDYVTEGKIQIVDTKALPPSEKMLSRHD